MNGQAMDTALGRAGRRIDGLLNPILVKEIRQAVRGRYLTSIFILFLVLQMAALGIFIVSYGSIDTDAGRALFGTLTWILFFVCMILVPLMACLRMASERSGENVDLMYISALRPWAIIRGKVLSTAALTLVIYSAFVPFITFSYLLRGVSLPTIIVTLGVGFLLVLFCIQHAITAAALTMAVASATNRALRIVPGLIAFSPVVICFFMTVSGVTGMMFREFEFDDPDFWMGLGTLVASVALLFGLSHTVAVALVSPPSSNRTMPVRLYVLGLWLASLGIVIGWSAHSGWDEMGDFVLIWSIFMTIALGITMLVSVSERNEPSRRVAQRIPRSVLRPLAFLFYHNCSGGILFCWLLMAATVALSYAGYIHFDAGRTHRSDSDWVVLNTLLVVNLYIAICAGIAWLLQRTAMKNKFGRHNTWMLTLMVSGATMLIPIVIEIARSAGPGYRHGSAAHWMLAPIGMAYKNIADKLPVAYSVVMIFVALLCLPLLAQDYAAFRRPEDAPAAPPPSPSMPPPPASL